DLRGAGRAAGEHGDTADSALRVVVGYRDPAQVQIAVKNADAAGLLGLVVGDRAVLEFDAALRKDRTALAQIGTDRSIVVEQVGFEADRAAYGINSAAGRGAAR